MYPKNFDKWWNDFMAENGDKNWTLNDWCYFAYKAGLEDTDKEVTQ